jgi:hypothetical protein
MQCVGQAAPMITVGLAVMRRGALRARITTLRAREGRTAPTSARPSWQESLKAPGGVVADEGSAVAETSLHAASIPG